MRIYETETVTREHEVLKETRCDLCGAVAKRGNWASGVYKVNDVYLEVKVHQMEGDSYPEGGWGTEYVVDLCPACFQERLVPWLREQGADIRELEWDW